MKVESVSDDKEIVIAINANFISNEYADKFFFLLYKQTINGSFKPIYKSEFQNNSVKIPVLSSPSMFE
jgi:hypothetical protein